MKERFKEFNFRADTLETIERADEIIEEYMDDGFTMTVRQIYYQFVSRGLLEENTIEQYNRMKSILTKGRLAGLIDWDGMEDRTRKHERRSSWESAAEYIMPEEYHIDLWADQEYRPEVWIEKDALVGVIEDVCIRLDVPYFACKGYSSASSTYEAAKRYQQHFRNGQIPIILHLGDHDPSGIDMTRDNRDRVSMFSRVPVQVKRLALNMDQVDEYNPPANFAKESDARFKDYRKLYGDECWELDALRPRVIVGVIEDAVAEIMDKELFRAALEREDEAKIRLREVADELDDE